MATERTIMITIGADGKAALAEMDKVNAGVRSISSEAKLMEQAMRYTSTAITGYFSTQLVKAVLDAAMQMESLQKKFTVFAGTADLGARELKFVRDAANELGLAIAPLTESYGRFMNAIKGTTNEGEKGRAAFLGISKGMAAVGMTADEQSRAWAQLNQGIMKGKFEMEDLKTINEAGLPIFKLLAEALGITTGELLKMQKEGKLLVEDVLPKLGASMEKAFGQAAAESAKSARANVERFNNAMLDAKIAAGEALLPVFTDIVKYATPAISKIQELVQAVQILGIKLAANAEKRSAFVDNLLSGTGVFSKDGLAKQKAAADKADALAQQMIDELLAGKKPTSSAYTPDEKAKAAGNKRQAPDDDSAKKAADHARKLAEDWRKSYADIRTEIENLNPALEKHDQEINKVMNRFSDLMQKEGADAVQLNLLRAELVTSIEARAQYDQALKQNKQELDDYAASAKAVADMEKANQQEAFDELAMRNKWAVIQDENNIAAQNVLALFQADLAEMNGDQGIARFREQLRLEEEAMIQSYAMSTDNFEVFEARKLQISELYGKKRESLDRMDAKNKMNLAAQGFGYMASAAFAFYELSGKKSKEAFLIYKGVKSAETIVSTASSAVTAYDNGLKAGGPYYGQVLAVTYAAAAIAAGAAQLASIWSATPEGGGSVASVGGSGEGSLNGLSSTAPSTSSDNTKAAPALTVIVNGNVVDHDKFARELMVSIQKAVNDGYSTTGWTTQ